MTCEAESQPGTRKRHNETERAEKDTYPGDEGKRVDRDPTPRRGRHSSCVGDRTIASPNRQRATCFDTRHSDSGFQRSPSHAAPPPAPFRANPGAPGATGQRRARPTAAPTTQQQEPQAHAPRPQRLRRPSGLQEHCPGRGRTPRSRANGEPQPNGPESHERRETPGRRSQRLTLELERAAPPPVGLWRYRREHVAAERDQAERDPRGDQNERDCETRPLQGDPADVEIAADVQLDRFVLAFAREHDLDVGSGSSPCQPAPETRVTHVKRHPLPRAMAALPRRSLVLRSEQRPESQRENTSGRAELEGQRGPRRVATSSESDDDHQQGQDQRHGAARKSFFKPALAC